MPLFDELIPLLSAGALAFSILTYVILDGTDLGVGILFAVNRKARHRHVMAFSILPIWDGNETWLVLGGGGLLAMFPAAYSIFLSAMYAPIILMLLALIFRGVSLEFRDRAKTERRQRLHDVAFMSGSIVASFCQGVVLGGLIQGIPHAEGQYSGNGWDWLSGFSVFCGLVLVVGYALLGACWLYWRTEDALQARSCRQARLLAVLTVVLLAGVVAWTFRLNTVYEERWLNPLIGIPFVALLIVLMAVFWRAFAWKYHFLPLFAVLGWFATAYAAMVVALYPLIIPPALTLAEAASAPLSQMLILAGFAVLIPATLAYSTFGFWVFRGKIRAKD
ncbi:cytochrome bd-I ubiquinol oxidase subunit 2 apoprotein [Pseudomonas duriflava]|uniref:Cytochrome bd-I ubiquinol oxidase subunit 2 apoprotein n=1 Tax=Pseudomonas duriflava TaxID=459528 RepID=A0A562PYS8_9PSED|nr:cytochrome d ubiquinol oxidase subunit II [Pseudomonas duriflava]TWI49246.1 cytochrome bd-I ubiquinol oxidase subunit 2 apoprotein [Pseudomonas duriflava]